jgi:hypothetical protein
MICFKLGLNSEEMLGAVRTISGLEYVEAYERMSWFVLEIALTFNTPRLFEDDSDLQSAKDAIIAALDQFAIPEGFTLPHL